tara:strand:- start:3663 stop:4349 length:687 start_codon:yes stop_codon:yes gene_type:complete
MYIGIYLATILSILHFISGLFIRFTKKYQDKLLSVATGILLAILFLELLPNFAKEALSTNYLMFFLPLMGFVAFHSIRTYNYRHIKTKKELKSRFRKNHILAFFIEHFILGFTLTLTFKDPIISLLLFLPFILLTVSSSILLDIIDKTSKKLNMRLLLGSSTILGAFVGLIFTLDNLLYLGTFGYAIGALFYIVIRDLIPAEEKKEKVLFFIAGLIITSILLLIKGTI